MRQRKKRCAWGVGVALALGENQVVSETWMSTQASPRRARARSSEPGNHNVTGIGPAEYA